MRESHINYHHQIVKLNTELQIKRVEMSLSLYTLSKFNPYRQTTFQIIFKPNQDCSETPSQPRMTKDDPR